MVIFKANTIRARFVVCMDTIIPFRRRNRSQARTLYLVSNSCVVSFSFLYGGLVRGTREDFLSAPCEVRLALFLRVALVAIVMRFGICEGEELLGAFSLFVGRLRED